MPPIFVSYRREDTEGETGRLSDVLANHYGRDSVFLDVEAIPVGKPFPDEIEKAVARCGVLLAVIGRNWIDQKDDAGDRRLENSGDFVRLEIASALRRDIPVVPVLVHGARMPRREQLPDDLKGLAYRNGVELTHARWRSDVDLLINALDTYVKDPPHPPDSGPSPWRSRLAILSLVLVAVVLGILPYLSHSRQAPVTQQTAPSSSGTIITPYPNRVPKQKVSGPAAVSPPVPSQTNPLPDEPAIPAKKVASKTGLSVPNFAGTWTNFEMTDRGITRPSSERNPLVITQNGSMVHIGDKDLPINQDGAVTYQTFFAADTGSGHEVTTADQADLVDTVTYRIEGQTLIYETLFDTRRPYPSGYPTGSKALVAYKYRR